eukprot:TRINITY_DN881_c0_g1_i1.p1 TRINITY_DN881_c0_g1~~TRINITY_DN881_c0_g1_i1.p1  ORF type:complete len:855 (+),score=268.36 TRINITY_DN881_c0_g1_i1:57-2621(+)
MRRRPTTNNTTGNGQDLEVISLKPLEYIHIHDTNTSATKIVTGPRIVTIQQHEKVPFLPPKRMIIIPKRHYCIIENPVKVENGKFITDEYGNIQVRHGEKEIRETRAPFPLYPNEIIVGEVTPLKVIAPLTALRLRSLRDFDDSRFGESVKRLAGDEFLIEGPATYLPKIEESILEIVKAEIIKPGNALRLRARKDFTDRNKNKRKAGEEWLVRENGVYLPGVNEEKVAIVKAITLTDKVAIHLKAIKAFTDVFDVKRKAGEEWLITNVQSPTYIPDVNEEVVRKVPATILSEYQYCMVHDPVIEGKQRIGQKLLLKGESTFFLQPGEKIPNGIQQVYLLEENEALLLQAEYDFVDNEGTNRKAGELWTVKGPCSYIPSVEVKVVTTRKAIPLDENEGIYVRDIHTGKVRLEKGKSYLLLPSEELWNKDLRDDVEDLLTQENGKKRVKHQVVSFRVRQNCAVRIYDYKEKKARIVLGPGLVMLGPDEQINVWNLSGDTPKKPGVIKALALQLGPGFMTDVFAVETSDHAKLQLQLAYNWRFEINSNDINECEQIFSVPDFVGDICKTIASKVRGIVASTPFDKFHKSSADIIRRAVFGFNEETEEYGTKFVNPTNGLIITGVDIQSVEPVDNRTRDSLLKSVQLAIEITTKSQEAIALHIAAETEQHAKGDLERQKIEDEKNAETLRKELIDLESKTRILEQTGEATTEAESSSRARQIESKTEVTKAKFGTEAKKIISRTELDILKEKQEFELEHQKSLTTLEIEKESELSEIESTKFKNIVKSIGAKTIKTIAQAGPEMQQKLLNSLGLKSLLITDGNSPINLFTTAQGIVGGNKQQGVNIDFENNNNNENK